MSLKAARVQQAPIGMKFFSLGTKGLKRRSSNPVSVLEGSRKHPSSAKPAGGPEGRPSSLDTTCTSVRSPRLRLCALPKTLRTLRPLPGRSAQRNAPPSPRAADSPSAATTAWLWASDFSFLRLQSPCKGSLVAAGTRLSARSGLCGHGSADHHPAGSIRSPSDGWTPKTTLALARPP